MRENPFWTVRLDVWVDETGHLVLAVPDSREATLTDDGWRIVPVDENPNAGV